MNPSFLPFSVCTLVFAACLARIIHLTLKARRQQNMLRNCYRGAPDTPDEWTWFVRVYLLLIMSVASLVGGIMSFVALYEHRSLIDMILHI